MKKNICILPFLTFLFIHSVIITKGQTSYFNASDLVKTGVYYYPEQWDKSQWDRDFKNMKKMGFEFTHMAEFAWAMLEPVEGTYDFKWLDEALELAQKNGLKVIMCTPTATPPVWLTKKYPEVLLVKEDGIQAKHGGRAHFSWSSAKYRSLVQKIITAMAVRYGKHPAVMGWQIDNEPSHYGTIDYGPEVKTNFQKWLQKKYQNIDSLNKSWGTTFWSQKYQAFHQIILPNAKTNVQQVNPHALLDFQRFNASECADYVAFQAKVLRTHIRNNQWVTTNFGDFHTKNDAWLNAKDLDFLSYTMYPVGGGYNNMDGLGEQGFRIGTPNRISFANDFFKYKKNFTAVMELQPGQVNWGLYNPQIFPGAIRAWLWNAYAGGCNLICSYRYRQPLFGGEQYHYGMVTTDGITPNVGGIEYGKFMEEIKQLRTLYQPNVSLPKDYAARKTGILWNWDNFWETEIQPQTNQWNPTSVIYKYHRILKNFNCPVDFISEEMDFDKYPTIVAPMYQLVDEKLIAKLSTYVQNGGHLILTARAGQMDKNAHLWQLPFGKMIEPLTGNKLLFFDVLPDNKTGTIQMNSKTYSWNNWADVVEPLPGTESLAVFTNQFYQNKTAATYRKLGKGSVTFIGADTDDAAFEKDVLRNAFSKSSIKTNEQPEGFILEWRDGFWIGINYNSEKIIQVSLPKGAKIYFGSATLKPAEVIVWNDADAKN